MSEANKCLHCSRELQSDNFGEQQQLDILLQWLCEITCIPWRKGWSGDPIPACPDGQYGVLDIVSSRLPWTPDSDVVRYENVNAVDEEGEPTVKHCCVLDFTETIELELSVHRESGKSTDCDEAQSQNPTRSAVDVLRHIRLMTYKDSLKDKKISWNREDKMVIRRVREDDDNGLMCGTYAEMDMTVNVCQVSSYPVDCSVFHYCVFNCEGLPLCLPPKTCE